MAIFGKYDPRKRDRNSPFAHPARGATDEWWSLLKRQFRRHNENDDSRVELVLQKFKNYEDDFLDSSRKGS